MSAVDQASGPLSHRSAARHGEVRLPASLAVLAAAVSHALLPNQLLLEPRWVVPVVEVALLVPLLTVNPTRLTRETKASRVIGLALVTVIIASNLVSLGHLIQQLTAAHAADGRTLLYAALQVWLTNMIAFALVYWEIDRGGAVARLPSSQTPTRRKDFWFPQDDPDLREGDWIPVFVDYLFVSVTNSTAFSPTDTLPLTTRAKLLMSLQAIVALVTSLLVIARAVNILH
jgi:uncharacterized membrane protein